MRKWKNDDEIAKSTEDVSNNKLPFEEEKGSSTTHGKVDCQKLGSQEVQEKQSRLMTGGPHCDWKVKLAYKEEGPASRCLGQGGRIRNMEVEEKERAKSREELTDQSLGRGAAAGVEKGKKGKDTAKERGRSGWLKRAIVLHLTGCCA